MNIFFSFIFEILQIFISKNLFGYSRQKFQNQQYPVHQ